MSDVSTAPDAPVTDGDDPATETITIEGISFTLSNPYAEGHTCTAGEASQLNQVRHENIRNNFAKKVKTAKESTAGADTAALQSELDAYDGKYQMGVRQRGAGGGGRTADPVLREARVLARAAIENALKKQGKKIADYDAKVISERVDQLAKNPEKPYMELAKARVAEKQQIADEALADVEGLSVAA